MPSALSIPEICLLVASDVSLRHIDLAHLALVSRDWHAIADAVLWADLPDLTYLLRLLPGQLWRYHPQGRRLHSLRRDPESFQLRRDLIPADWDAVVPKSALVKRLRVRTTYSPSVQASIMASPPAAGFLCNAHSLRLDIGRDIGYMNYQFIASVIPVHSLVDLEMAMGRGLRNRDLHNLLSLCLHLSQLNFHVVLGGDEGSTEIVHTLQAVGLRLSSLHLSVVLDTNIAILAQLLAIPSLHYLHLVSLPDNLPDQPALYPPPALLDLRTLRTTNVPLRILIDVIRLSAHRLESLAYLCNDATPVDLDLLAHAVGELCVPYTLKKLQIMPARYTGDDHLQHLAPLARLEGMHIMVQCSNTSEANGYAILCRLMIESFYRTWRTGDRAVLPATTTPRGWSPRKPHKVGCLWDRDTIGLGPAAYEVTYRVAHRRNKFDVESFPTERAPAQSALFALSLAMGHQA
ncbi:hypothetical protein FB107DRAFT_252705 [Schizophyllum commune]